MFHIQPKPGPRRKAVRILWILLGALTLLLTGCADKGPSAEPTPIPASTNDERLAYLRELGWEVDPEPVETLVMELSQELLAQYGDFAALQEEQGFSLAQCAGKTVSCYTYAVGNYPGYQGPVQIQLYVCDGLVVGGCTFAPGEDGFMGGMAYPE